MVKLICFWLPIAKLRTLKWKVPFLWLCGYCGLLLEQRLWTCLYTVQTCMDLELLRLSISTQRRSKNNWLVSTRSTLQCIWMKKKNSHKTKRKQTWRMLMCLKTEHWHYSPTCTHLIFILCRNMWAISPSFWQSLLTESLLSQHPWDVRADHGTENRMHQRELDSKRGRERERCIIMPDVPFNSVAQGFNSS